MGKEFGNELVQNRRESGLYPDILFHFTSKECLFQILENNFAISYATETIVGRKSSKKLGVPMVSFCDLRLSELKQHMENYRCYGIGLRKEWAKRNGLNPVFYVNQTCPATEGFIYAIDDLYKRITDAEEKGINYDELAPGFMYAFNMFRYIKNYEGELERKDGTRIPNYRFANEREWRYVPPLTKDISPLAQFVPPSYIDTAEKKKKLNATWHQRPLVFEPEDVRYLIVESDQEREELIHHLQNVKERFGPTTIRRLASRILDADQIYDDV